MKRKRHFICYAIITLLTVIILLLLIIIAMFAVLLKNTSKEETAQESVTVQISPSPEVSPFPEVSPTNPPGPDYVTYAIIINGNLLHLINEGNGMVPPHYLEKIEQAEFLGETREPVQSGEFPKEELQSNYIPAGYEVYHYVSDEEDSYFVYSEENFYCIYAKEWYVIELPE